MEKHDDTIKTISVKLDALYNNPDCINTEVREEIKELQKLRSNIECESSRAKRQHPETQVQQTFEQTYKGNLNEMSQ